MMGRQRRDQGKLFYEFRLDDRIPKDHLLRRIDVFVTAALADLHKELEPYYSDIGRPSVDPELMIRMLIVGYCCGLRSERRLAQEVGLQLAHRWFCKLDLEDEVPHHSTFSLNRLGRFRESGVLRHVFERIVWAAMAMGLVKGEGFAVDASVLEANASRYHGKAPEELDWSEKQRQTRALAARVGWVKPTLSPEMVRRRQRLIVPVTRQRETSPMMWAALYQQRQAPEGGDYSRPHGSSHMRKPLLRKRSCAAHAAVGFLNRFVLGLTNKSAVPSSLS